MEFVGMLHDSTLQNSCEREETYTYFVYNERNKRLFDGLSHLVGRTIYKADHLHKNIDQYYILLHLLLTKLLSHF